MAGVVLNQIKFSIAAFEDGIVGDVAPFVIAGPAGNSLGNVADQEFAAAHMFHRIPSFKRNNNVHNPLIYKIDGLAI